MSEIIKSRYCGFCSGVNQAIKKAYSAAAEGEVVTMGPIIHNPQVVEKLRRNNIIDKNCGAGSIKGGSTVLIRSHGIPLSAEKKLKEKGCRIIDATCRKVKKAQKIFSKLAARYDRVFIAGIKTHPEVRGILSRAPSKGVVISGPREAAEVSGGKNAGIIAQTTFRREKFFQTVFEILNRFDIVEMHNTICQETVCRQDELGRMAALADIFFVVGGKNSSNTKRLFELAGEKGRAYHIETADEISPYHLKGGDKIGIATGASTPVEIVEEIEDKIKKIKSKQGE